jgi:NADH dehydrogenase
MQVLVTGATGFVGQAVCRELALRRYRVTALVRRAGSPAAQSLAKAAGAVLLEGGVGEAGAWRDKLSGHQAVIHLVGIISEAGSATFEHVHVRTTANVLAAASAAGVKRFIQMSALGTRPHAVSRYHQTKWAAETLVRASGLDWTIFRPSLIYGRHSGFVRTFERISRYSPLVPVIGSGRAQMQPVSVDAVTRSFVGALEEPRAAGRVFDLTGHETLSFVEVLRALLKALGRHRLLLHLPLPLARAQASLLEVVLGRWLKLPPPLNRDQIAMLQEDNTGDGRPAAELFGLKPVRFADDLARMLR